MINHAVGQKVFLDRLLQKQKNYAKISKLSCLKGT